jgi:hydroxymethylglutaryl-CoA lyase
MGVTRYESSIGGLGDCPFAPGAAGNIATEDLINTLHRVNIQTGIDLNKLIQLVHVVEDSLPVTLSGHVMRGKN